MGYYANQMAVELVGKFIDKVKEKKVGKKDRRKGKRSADKRENK